MTTRSRARLQGGFSLGDILKVAKDTKIISNVLGAIPNKYAQTAGQVTGALGFGKPKRPRKKQSATGIISDVAGMLGLGKRKPRKKGAGKKNGAGKKRIVNL